jgi:lincosamide nucleotidyltransferase
MLYATSTTQSVAIRDAGADAASGSSTASTVGSMLIQHQMIDRVRHIASHDDRIVAALMYGSFLKDEADRFSDIEFWLYFDSPDLDTVDPQQWCEQIRPVQLLVVNEFDTHVAIFDNLVRGEFHFASTERIREVRQWPIADTDPARMIVIDRRGALTRALHAAAGTAAAPTTNAEVEQLVGRTLNWLVLGYGVQQRGEHARAAEVLAGINRHLLWLLRLDHGATMHWQAPSRRVEHDLPADVIDRYLRTTADAHPDTLDAAYRAAIRLAAETIASVAQTWHIPNHQALLRQLPTLGQRTA